MIKKILKIASTGFVYFAIATLIAQGIILTYTWFAWDITWQRGQDAMAVAKGKANIESTIDLENIEEQIAKEQPSFEEILRVRALKTRDFELRDEALSQEKAILRQQQDTLAQKSEVLNVAKIGFEQQVANYESRSQAEGLEQNVVILQGIKADMAKIQLLELYRGKEMTALIDIVKAMETKKLTKIINLFTTKDDEKKVGDILRRIRDGFEFKPPIETTANFPPQM